MDIHVSPQIERLIRDSLDEDIGAGDLATMATISAESRGTGSVSYTHLTLPTNREV